jgi:hypothetical protein
MAEVTYGQLDEVLRSLGFSVEVLEDKTKWYKHEATGAVVALPDVKTKDPVTPHHLVAVRAILEAYGLADPLDFASKLQKAS